MTQVIRDIDVLQGMTAQLSNTFFYISIFLMVYIALDIFVFQEGARFYEYFDRLKGIQVESMGNLKDLTHEVTTKLAFTLSMVLVVMNIIYRVG